MEAREIRLRKGLGRLLNAWFLLARSKRALFGISVILLYVFIAVAAPLITPYDPSKDSFLANDHASPSWYRTLGIQKGLSGNLILAQPEVRGFATPGSISAWNLTTSRPDIVSLQYSSVEGDAAPGSMGIYVVPRSTGTPYGSFDFTIYKRFTYPYDGFPGRFFASISARLRITGDETVIYGSTPPVGTGLNPPIADDTKIRFVDSNSNGVRDGIETVAYDNNGNGVFDVREQVLFGSPPSPGAALKNDPKIRYVDSNTSNARDSSEVVVYDSNSNRVYDAPTPPITLTAFIDQSYLRIRFVDSNANNVWDSAETVVHDSNGNGVYDSGEPIIAGNPPPLQTSLNGDSKVRYIDSDNSNSRDSNEAVVYDSNSNGVYDTGEPIVFGSAPAVGTVAKEGNASFKIWDKTLPVQQLYPSSWFRPDPPIDTVSTTFIGQYFSGPESSTRAENLVFTQPVTYVFRLSVQIKDRDPSLPLNASFFVDDLNLTLLGTSYGIFGTDQQGRDLFTQLVYGARISLIVGLLATFLGIVLGLVVGLLAGFKGGLTDESLMRFTDMLLVLPGLPLLLILAAVLTASIWTIIGILGFLGWMGFARVIRSQVVSLKERPFVEASKAVGAGTPHLIVKHILPNVMGLTWITLATGVPGAITAEAALSFLGLFDPFLMSWGRILYNAESFQGFFYPWWVLPPGLSIALLSLAFILIGYALDDILNPRLRQRR